MKKTVAIFLFVLTSAFLSAQDSTKIVTQEIGFNTVSLVKQLISNNPSSTLPQLPYDLFYNVYYEDLIGLRLGAGIINQYIETSVTGQIVPRTTDNKSLNLRIGLSYNFLKTKRLAFNVFGDFLIEKGSSETAFTSTITSFPNPVITQTTKITEKLNGSGGQIGVGVKYNILKNLSIYAEVPFVFLTEKSSSSVFVNRSGLVSLTDDSSKTTTSRIILPTTIYLVLRF